MTGGYIMYTRRKFIKTSAYAGAGLAGLALFPSSALARGRETVKLTILHTNDQHSHIEPFLDNDPKYPGLGGMARRAAVIEQIRNIEENVLLFDAGDIFQGTPYFNKYGGELEFKLMSIIGYDASAIGNHDLDNGLEGLDKMLPHAAFSFICSNYDFSDTILHQKISQYKIFNKGGIKIGVFGLGIELAGLVGKKLYGNTQYYDPIASVAQMAFFLKQKMKCELVICLSHLGFKYAKKKIDDWSLAEESMNIDLIIGGHTHTFLDKPLRLKGRDGKEVLVCQAGWTGVRLGRIDYYFSHKAKKKITVEASYQTIKQDGVG